MTIAEDIHTDPSPKDIRYVFGVAAVLDMNGDGTMELVLTSGYYEGNAAAVIAANGLEIEPVLIEGCGA